MRELARASRRRVGSDGLLARLTLTFLTRPSSLSVPQAGCGLFMSPFSPCAKTARGAQSSGGGHFERSAELSTAPAAKAGLLQNAPHLNPPHFGGALWCGRHRRTLTFEHPP